MPCRRFSLRHADVFQRLDQHVLFEFLGTGEFHLGDGRAFLDQHHQYLAVGFQAHVLEETGGIQRLDGGDTFIVVEGLAHAHRQVAEDRTGFRPLDAFDADVLDHEGFDRHGVAGTQYQDGGADQTAAHGRWSNTVRI